MLIGFFTFEIVVFNGSNHILSKGDVAANVVAPLKPSPSICPKHHSWCGQ